jgi:hypothetical protein
MPAALGELWRAVAGSYLDRRAAASPTPSARTSSRWSVLVLSPVDDQPAGGLLHRGVEAAQAALAVVQGVVVGQGDAAHPEPDQGQGDGHRSSRPPQLRMPWAPTSGTK